MQTYINNSTKLNDSAYKQWALEGLFLKGFLKLGKGCEYEKGVHAGEQERHRDRCLKESSQV